MNKTTIEWTDYTWNPVTGCDKISAGCRSCYAETIANRFWGNRKFTDVQMHEDRLSEPGHNVKKWRGKKVFVCSMSDLFHESVTFNFIADVFIVMAFCKETTFQILTKRPQRALEFMKWAAPIYFEEKFQDGAQTYLPPKNIWIGVSCENQEQADKRIPLLLQIPTTVRFLSCEPLIGPIDICQSIRLSQHPNEIHTTFFGDKLHWVIAGGESGHHARPMHPDWVRSLRDQCAAARVPFFFKQWGEWMPSENLDGDMFYVQMGHAFGNDENGKPIKQRRSHLFDNGAHKPGTIMFKFGKSKSGNLLDGVQHLNFPL